LPFPLVSTIINYFLAVVKHQLLGSFVEDGLLVDVNVAGDLKPML
jgi:hypothetical protein